ncbi:MAG: 16S rRNA (cytidine(1402)-2'-O)-methyltransferase [Desulfobacterales bacterium]|uniref:Ribosomal RNA small subunit methyltransferase I n=1 Tax=Candidatus Desulfatibia profunda TaxID=2841695 RepID=A0A8J6NRS5_9BACT|nr:16S rRNA (cytidine(1402)-2'-O)-methyltransferase [Candidatus Desulfatibia profunda]MBL7180192.1 16S rRNA (cytidine(1402)-2'-O)-methyltransferase [Desulfobacterales bacterium]
MLLNSPTDNSGHTQKPGELYVVATPIGNMKDITIRALEVLGQVDLIAAEDTRHTGRLLAHHQIKGRFVSYHEHNEAERTPELLNKLKTGLSVALVSNAGTPSVSDPGYRLISAAVAGGINVIPVPGVSAAVCALSAAGLPTDSFVFVGFPASKKARRLKQLEQLAREPRTIIFYESPRRMLTLLQEIVAMMGDRYGVLGREMTKLHAEFVRGHLSEIHSRLKARSAIKGECTLLVTGCQETQDVSLETIRNEIIKRLEATDDSLRDLAKTIAKKYGISKNKVYEEALKIKGKMQGAERKA